MLGNPNKLISQWEPPRIAARSQALSVPKNDLPRVRYLVLTTFFATTTWSKFSHASPCSDLTLTHGQCVVLKMVTRVTPEKTVASLWISS